MTEMAIEFIKRTGLIKCASWLKHMIDSICQKWIPIAAHAIITHAAKPILRTSLVCNRQSSLFQNSNLISETLNLFGICYFIHSRQQKRLTLSALISGKRGELVAAKVHTFF